MAFQTGSSLICELIIGLHNVLIPAVNMDFSGAAPSIADTAFQLIHQRTVYVDSYLQNLTVVSLVLVSLISLK